MDAASLPDFHVLPYREKEKCIKVDCQEVPVSPLTDSVTLKTSSSWTYCGPLLDLEPALLPSSFHTWADATINGSVLAPLLSFLAFVHEFLAKNSLGHYWLTIRASQGSHEFDTPRWHTDDLFFSPIPPTGPVQRCSWFSAFSNGIRSARRAAKLRPRRRSKDLTTTHDNTFREKLTSPGSNQITTDTPGPANWKLTTTLLGPGTLFIAQQASPLARDIQRATRQTVRAAHAEHVCLSVRCAGCSTAAESVRAKLAAALGRHGTVQARAGECVFFRVGEDEGAVHSEPMSHGDRIFVNVVPGHEADLKSLMARWGMEYPRAWCVGLPFQGAEETCWRNVGEL
ncbi:uncharacterized protein N7459_008007 [Penicillium hispanicum]|uniref:uncharacterized protein n=1 Tax=Penicillium hispanicum TaxID=1080232 RepID=UPI002540637E|nr:uncharacterized protein N7459_008007 [Penicillium hispanicum]KAJ5573580.1 hypothetical protein N7459_008007 [Penicillium hispanicum]